MRRIGPTWLSTLFISRASRRAGRAALPEAAGATEAVAAIPAAVVAGAIPVVAEAAIRAAAAADGAAVVVARASRQWTARRSWRRLPRAPEAGTSRPRRRTTWTRSTA